MTVRGIGIVSGGSFPSPTFTGTVTFPDGSTWTSTGLNAIKSITLNDNAASPPAVLAGELITIANLDATATRATLVSYGSSTAYSGRTSGGTAATPSAVPAATLIVQMNAYGWDTAWTTAAAGAIQIRSINQWSGTDNSTRVTINTTPSGSKTAGTSLIIDDTQTSALGVVTSANATAPAAGGSTSCGIKASSTANLGLFFGTGAPTLSAAKGSLYSNTTATTTITRFYVNTDGGTTWASFVASL